MSDETPQKTKDLEYDSNPFTLSFKGFGLLVDYAKGVLIALIIFGFLGFLSNFISTVVDLFDTSDNSTSSLRTETIVTDSPNIDFDWGIIAGIGALIIGVIVVVIVVSLLFSAAFKGFIAAGTVAAVSKRKITAGEAFSEMGNRFGTLFGAEIQATLRIIGGYLLFVVPGVRAQLRYQSTPFIIMADKEISASGAIKKSKELYNKHLMEVFGINTVGAIIPLIGQAITASGMAMSVQQISAYSESGQETPKTHWLNYIGLIVGLIFFVLIAGLLSIVFVALVSAN